MKKHVLLAMAVIMLLGTFKAMAQSEQEAMDMNQQSKVEAGIRNQQWGSLVDQDAKIQGSDISKITEIRLLSYKVGTALGKQDIPDAFKDNSFSQLDFEAHQNYVDADSSQDGKQIAELLKSSESIEATLQSIIKNYDLTLQPLSAKEISEILNGK